MNECFHLDIDVTEEKKSINDFLHFIKGKKVLLVEGTHSQENLLYKGAASASNRGIVSVSKELNRLRCHFRKIDSSSPLLSDAIEASDVVFIYAHGEYGEDGRLQGWLDYKDKKYTGSGVLASAICLDKVVFKRVISSAGLPTPKFEELSDNKSSALCSARKMDFPLMAKLRNGGE